MQPISRQHWRTLVFFSVVFSLNISVGNYSSLLVPVSFNQVCIGIWMQVYGVSKEADPFAVEKK